MSRGTGDKETAHEATLSFVDQHVPPSPSIATMQPPGADPLAPSSSLFSLRTVFLFALVVRLVPVVLLPQTYFQPDEFWQALEPAHHLVFGSGWLTWEWRKGAYIRGWLWPIVFAGVYKALQMLGLDKSMLLTRGPRLMMAIIAAVTDWYTYRLAGNVLGVGYREAAVRLISFPAQIATDSSFRSSFCRSPTCSTLMRSRDRSARQLRRA